MNDEYLLGYNSMITLALTTLEDLKKDQFPEDKIINCSGYCHPLQFLYELMTKQRSLTRISDLPKERKAELWEIVKNKDWKDYRKIWVLQALYLFNELKGL